MPMKRLSYILLLITCIACAKPKQEIEFWLTDPNQPILFEKQDVYFISESEQSLAIDSEIIYQEMDGFGFTLSQGSAQHLLGMSDSARLDLLKELFGDDEKSIRISYLRLSVAASDLNEYPFSYNDLS
ncbi:MAG TPA: glucosylceramidase, partial [Algoriphagus sp.]|nr:glucosylceramidase [Algoriphagus sp.]